ncbi:MAG TPA: FkbM family methyltransferase [Edaphobacter sp.]|nr:FkbM family methyltransferase [Edaphobacter sp.]
MSDLQSDYMSVLELGVIDVYHLDHGFHPDLVIDGGGNIGMFTLRAAACLTPQGDSPIRFVVCEPVPTNIKQIRKNLEINRIEANILPVCLGGAHRTIPFYCREANQSSFDSSKPYTSQIEVPVIPLQDALGSNSAERILIKLDIEGMEVETLSAYIPQEKRAVYIVGELHEFSVNAPLMEELFQRNGWTLEIFGIADDLATFRACSPAALPLLKSISKVQARSYVTAAI